MKKGKVFTVEDIPNMVQALRLWRQFWDEMPKGQLGKIVCDIGILNQAFLATDKALAGDEE